MSIKLNYLKKTINKPTGNIVLFSNEKFKTNINNIYASDNHYIFIDSNAQNMVEVLTTNLNLFE